MPLPHGEPLYIYAFNPFKRATLHTVLQALLQLASHCEYTLVLKAVSDSELEAAGAWCQLRPRLRKLSHRAVGLAPAHCFSVWRVASPARPESGQRRLRQKVCR